MLNRTHHIGVVGLTESGKTTLLTSLMDHWNNHQTGNLPLGDRASNNELVLSWIGKDEASGRRRFQKHRSSLSVGEWVDKSLQSATYSFRLDCDRWYRGIPIMLHDIPGERLADAEMLRQKCLADWSDSIVHYIETDPSLRTLSSDFLDLFHKTRDASETSLTALHRAYRSMIATFVSNGIPLVTPSSMLVDANGAYVPENARSSSDNLKDWFTNQCHLGLDGKPIVPVPNCFRNQRSSLWENLCSNYVEYRKHIVLPALQSLARCQDVLFLVDIAGILRRGSHWKNQASSLIQSFVESVAPSNRSAKLWGSTLHYASLGLIAPRVNRLFFVATQIDRIHRDDRSKIVPLLKDLARPAVRSLVSRRCISVEYCVAAAVDSSESLPNNELRYMEEGAGKSSTVSVLPDRFPDDWKPGDFQFPWMSPRIPTTCTNPPKQYGLDKITELLLSIR